MVPVRRLGLRRRASRLSTLPVALRGSRRGRPYVRAAPCTGPAATRRVLAQAVGRATRARSRSTTRPGAAGRSRRRQPRRRRRRRPRAWRGQAVLDLGRVDVLAAGHDHLVVAALDDRAGRRAEAADVAGRPSARRRRSLPWARGVAGVALEQQRVADEHPAHRRRRAPRAPSSSNSRTTVPIGGLPAVPGARRSSAGRGDRGPGDTRSTRRRCRGGRRTGPSTGLTGRPAAPTRWQRRPARRRGRSGPATSSGSSRTRCSITGMTTAASHGVAQGAAGSPRGRSAGAAPGSSRAAWTG